MHAHLVFVTKFRRNVFTKPILNDLSDIFSTVCKDFEAELVEFDGEDDHVNLIDKNRKRTIPSIRCIVLFIRCGATI
jgi:hypothetical protein